MYTRDYKKLGFIVSLFHSLHPHLLNPVVYSQMLRKMTYYASRETSKLFYIVLKCAVNTQHPPASWALELTGNIIRLICYTGRCSLMHAQEQKAAELLALNSDNTFSFPPEVSSGEPQAAWTMREKQHLRPGTVGYGDWWASNRFIMFSSALSYEASVADVQWRIVTCCIVNIVQTGFLNRLQSQRLWSRGTAMSGPGRAFVSCVVVKTVGQILAWEREREVCRSGKQWGLRAWESTSLAMAWWGGS